MSLPRSISIAASLRLLDNMELRVLAGSGGFECWRESGQWSLFSAPAWAVALRLTVLALMYLMLARKRETEAALAVCLRSTSVR